jgi:hypothetical protein
MAETKKINPDVLKIGAGIAALAAAYFFLGPDSKKHQKKFKGWMVRMKGEVLEKLEDVQELTQPIYTEIVDTIAKAEEIKGKIPQQEIESFASDLKRQWKVIKSITSQDKRRASSLANKTKRGVRKTTRK